MSGEFGDWLDDDTWEDWLDDDTGSLADRDDDALAGCAPETLQAALNVTALVTTARHEHVDALDALWRSFTPDEQIEAMRLLVVTVHGWFIEITDLEVESVDDVLADFALRVAGVVR